MAAACGLALLAAYQWSRSRSGRPNPPPKKVRLGPVALDKDRKIPFKLVKREEVSHDTRKFTFELQSAEHVLGLPVGNHMYLSARVGGELVRRPYTPVTSDDELGFFELVIKVGHTELHTHACGMSRGYYTNRRHRSILPMCIRSFPMVGKCRSISIPLKLVRQWTFKDLQERWVCVC